MKWILVFSWLLLSYGFLHCPLINNKLILKERILWLHSETHSSVIINHKGFYKALVIQ